MGKSKYQGDSPLLVSAAALLTKQRISYVDDGKYTVVKFSPKGNYLHKVLKFPKDGHTDALRFTEALQEKIPLVDGCYPIKVLPPPLEGKVGSATPAMNSKFYKGWEHRDAALTCFRWDGAFTTLPYLYRQDGVYQEVDLSGEHYYNILMTRPQKEEFEKVNPEFFFEECPGTCATKRGYPHFHAIHGFYVGSDVGDVGCAPPWRLCDAWRMVETFIPSGGPPGVSTEDPCAASGESSDYFTQTWLDDFCPYEGTTVLASVCEAPEEGWNPAEWGHLCQMYQRPEAATWALAKASETFERGHRATKDSWSRLYADSLMPKLREGVPIFEMLQLIWEADGSNSKFKGNYLLRKVCIDRKIVCSSQGILKR